MRELPILFSGPMVRAILDGSKTQTRRLVTPHTSFGGSAPVKWCDLDQAWPDGIGGPKYLHAPISFAPEEYDRTCVNRIYPRWAPATDWEQEPEPEDGYVPPASRLWVREAHRWIGRRDGDRWSGWIEYRADGALKRVTDPHALRPIRQLLKPGGASEWRPSIYMPRWASRITLEVTEVRPERLQDISEEDALAEGVRGDEGPSDQQHAVDYFATLWDSINATRAPWESNPWVWVVSFRGIDT